MWDAERVVADLTARGELWQPVPGIIGLRGDALELYGRIERRIAELAISKTGEAWLTPPAIGLEALARAEYFESFPQWLTAAGHLSDDPAALEAVARAGDPAAAARGAMAPVDAALPPAVCYHAYAALADRVLDAPRLITSEGTCWRHEGDRLRPLERGWAFTMREIVCIGGPADVESLCGWGREAATALAAGLGIDSRVEPATDPFFAPTSRGRALLQRVKELKLEVLIPIGADRRVAAASFNRHDSFFGERFSIRLADGSPAATGCVAFGIERWLLAFLVAHGTDSGQWPAVSPAPLLKEA